MLSLTTTAALASTAEFYESARVLNVVPQLEQVSIPRQYCQTEYEPVVQQEVNRSPERNVGGAILGGLAGGLLGSRVGGGNGRIAAAAIGAATGALVGDRMDNNDQNVNRDRDTTTSYNQPVRRCHTTNIVESRTVGYLVTYEYNNRTFRTVTPYDPGTSISIAVTVTPRP
ncbi:MAG: glycine zipper 2TM domain-containing protein [Agitococcus sp.]|nr:glycine zipper 2TM domain-containing protein [Agitococcus sp.]